MPVDGSSNSPRSALQVTRHPPGSLAISSIGTSTPSIHHSAQDAQSLELRLRIRQIEEKLARKTPSTQQSPASTTTSNIENFSTTLGGTFQVHCEQGSLGQSQPIARNMAHKTRLFGQSHWTVNSILLVSTYLGTHQKQSLLLVFGGLLNQVVQDS